MMTIEKLTEFRKLFEEFKISNDNNHESYIDLIKVMEVISLDESKYRITLDEFGAFFDEKMNKSNIITDREFSELISKYESEVLQQAGIN